MPIPTQAPAPAPAGNLPVTDGKILGKFNTVDDLGNAYRELEKKLGTENPVAPVATETAPSTPAEPTAPATPAETPAAPSTDPFASYSAEFAKEGKLSDESYKTLAEKHGLSRQSVDLYIEGVRARASQFETAILAEVGGQEKFDAVRNWAAENLPDADIQAFNSAVANTTNPAAAKLAVAGLVQRFNAAHPAEPNLNFSGQSQPTVSGYKSQAEWLRDLNDARYSAGDLAFHQSVDAKLAASPWPLPT
jgi:hypothetical protein